MEKMEVNNSFWKDKKVLITGHNGFKGSWLTMWLSQIGAEIYGISLKPNHDEKNLFIEADVGNLCQDITCDIQNLKDLKKEISNIKPDIIFHLAAQSLVRESYRDPILTFNTNIMGTANILDSMLSIDSVKVAVMVTTDKVYKNNEWLWPYRENDHLGGFDPYSSSKAASEIIISSYLDSFLRKQGVAIASARAGNVIGGGDWSKERLIPDAIKAWSNDDKVEIRNPSSTRPWQHVLDPLNGYLVLAEKLWFDKDCSGPYNFGPGLEGTTSVKDVIEIAHSIFKRGSIEIIEDNSNFHEAGMLALDPSKSKNILGVNCSLNTKQAIHKTIDWYINYNKGSDPFKLCIEDINSYLNLK